MQPSRTTAVSVQHKERFQKEVMLLFKMKHDNIVKVKNEKNKKKISCFQYYVIYKQGFWWIWQFVGACIEPQLMIVTELLEGGTLQKFLWDTRPCPLDLKMSISFALDISQAMEFLHSNGIIHRDLKPSNYMLHFTYFVLWRKKLRFWSLCLGNVLVTSDMNQVKLADFGLAREESTGCMTSEAGTYRYMAPEVIILPSSIFEYSMFHRNIIKTFYVLYQQVFSREPLKTGEKKHYDHKVDVYSFAIVFWELLTNKQPFHGVPNICTAYLVSQVKITINKKVYFRT